MGSVDDFWRQLNVKKGPKATLSGLTDIPGLTSQTRTLPSNTSATKSVPTPKVLTHPASAALPDQQGLQVSQPQLSSRL